MSSYFPELYAGSLISPGLVLYTHLTLNTIVINVLAPAQYLAVAGEINLSSDLIGNVVRHIGGTISSNLPSWCDLNLTSFPIFSNAAPECSADHLRKSALPAHAASTPGPLGQRIGCVIIEGNIDPQALIAVIAITRSGMINSASIVLMGQLGHFGSGFCPGSPVIAGSSKIEAVANR